MLRTVETGAGYQLPVLPCFFDLLFLYLVYDC